MAAADAKSITFSAVTPKLDAAVSKDAELNAQMLNPGTVSPGQTAYAELCEMYSEAISMAVTIGIFKSMDQIEPYLERYHAALLQSQDTPGVDKKSGDRNAKMIKGFRAQITSKSSTENTWDSLKGNERAKNLLKDAIELPVLFPKLFVGKREAPRYILLYGPPGTGKTMLARVAANEISADFLAISPSSILGGLVGENERNITSVFEASRQHSRETGRPVVIFMDEMDGIAPDRSKAKNDGGTSVGMVNTLLAEMEGFATDTSIKVFVLGATNYKDNIDAAVLSRFKQKIEILLPDRKSVIGMLKDKFEQIPNELDEQHYMSIADTAVQNQLAGRDITSMFQDVTLKSARLLKADEYMSVKTRPIIGSEKIVFEHVKDDSDTVQVRTWLVPNASKAARKLKMTNGKQNVWVTMRRDDVKYLEIEQYYTSDPAKLRENIKTATEAAMLSDNVPLEPAITFEDLEQSLRELIESKRLQKSFKKPADDVAPILQGGAPFADVL